ncbi:MAG: peptide-methionine (S)-S-oxide reductase MsrA [Candidimonas sp.]
MNGTISDKTETAILGGGCFWCTEAVFAEIDGVLDVQSGYCGGHVDNPTYEQVCGKATGHIEVVRIRFDPGVIDFETVLLVFFASHDPTTLDRQGADVGPQYASAIFVQSDEQRGIAERVMRDVQRELDNPIVTRILPAAPFWPAEEYHKDYYALHPSQGYCRMVISPKLNAVRKRFMSLLK